MASWSDISQSHNGVPLGLSDYETNEPQKSSSLASESRALVEKDKYNEVFVVDKMGSDVVIFFVGPHAQEFSVHRKLLLSAGWGFLQVLKTHSKSDKMLEDESPPVIRLFLEFLYTKRVPCVLRQHSDAAKGSRIKELCQLYAFAEDYQVNHYILNKIMDAIQDGFVLFNRFPEAGLISGIYSKTQPGSKLREFCAASIVYQLKSSTNNPQEGIKAALQGNSGLMDDFLTALTLLDNPDRDPRIRDCLGEAGCVECLDNPGKLNAKTGVWPCLFHVHHKVGYRGLGDIYDDASRQQEQNVTFDDGCYLWEL